MKKLFSIILVTLLCLCFASNSFAAGTHLSLDAFQPENSNLDVKVDITANSALYTTEFYITYESDKIEFVEGSVTTGDAAQELSPYLIATLVEPGRLKISYTATEALNNAGTLCRMSFKPRGNHYVTLDLEIEHAEGFDGENFPALEFIPVGTSTHVTEIPFWAGENIAAAAVVLVMLFGIAVVIVLRIKHKKKEG
ncbi:MAG: hypothetical protein IJE14_01820 [Clostridia bacterium]|nr:hypothetical protein [Clostridia bacterium]